jgi:hypothetical protein
MHITDEGDDGKVRKAEFCGPATHLAKRLARGDKGINELDRNCKDHDIWYRDHRTAKERHPADLILAQHAARIANDTSKPTMQRKKAKLVAAILSGKAFLGLGSPLAFKNLLATIGMNEMKRRGGIYGGNAEDFHMVPTDNPSVSNAPKNNGLLEATAKLISMGLDKLIDYSINRKKKKEKVMLYGEYMKQKEKQKQMQMRAQRLKPIIVQAPQANLEELWPGTNIKIYKKNGTKKTRKELEDELYLGLTS